MGHPPAEARHKTDRGISPYYVAVLCCVLYSTVLYRTDRVDYDVGTVSTVTCNNSNL